MRARKRLILVFGNTANAHRPSKEIRSWRVRQRVVLHLGDLLGEAVASTSATQAESPFSPAVHQANQKGPQRRFLYGFVESEQKTIGQRHRSPWCGGADVFFLLLFW